MSLISFVKKIDARKLALNQPTSSYETEERDWKGRTLVDIAVDRGDTEVLAVVLDWKTPINHRNRWGKTTLDRALRKGASEEVINLLRKRGAVSGVAMDPAGEALLRDSDPDTVLLPNKDGFHISMEEDLDPVQRLLHVAIIGMHLEAYPSLVHARDRYGCTPLHLAAENGADWIIPALVSAGADINATDGRGATPLIHTVIQHHDDAFEKLLKIGADPDLETPWGTPRDVALDGEFTSTWIQHLMTCN